MTELTLYSYFRSSCSYRVRIALALKDLSFETRYVHLLKHGGEQHTADYQQHNPQAMVPTLVDAPHVMTQSIAIIEYLEERYPEPSLLPGDVGGRVYLRALAQLLVCDIQPLNNLRVIKMLKQGFSAEEDQVKSWYQHWVTEGFVAFESLLGQHHFAGTCCYGNSPSLADICLIPQVYNALRFDCDLSAMPQLYAIYEHCISLPAFQKAAPENQPDFD
jgi:maleylacetoacetate isomerase